jgi:hypothetical protein
VPAIVATRLAVAAAVALAEAEDAAALELDAGADVVLDAGGSNVAAADPCPSVVVLHAAATHAAATAMIAALMRLRIPAFTRTPGGSR